LYSGIDKKRIKSRLTSKKKKQAESCVEKHDVSPSSASIEKHDISPSPASEMSTLNSAELSELQELLRQKRCQLELQDEISTSVAVTSDLDLQHTETGIIIPELSKTVFIKVYSGLMLTKVSVLMLLVLA